MGEIIAVFDSFDKVHLFLLIWLVLYIVKAWLGDKVIREQEKEIHRLKERIAEYIEDIKELKNGKESNSN